MEPIDIQSLVESLEDDDDRFLEFFRSESMSLELYRLQAGAEDPQEPHTEDEVYYILRGTARIRIGDEVHPIGAGDLVYVEREVDHAFEQIEEDILALVFFAPPYRSNEDR